MLFACLLSILQRQRFYLVTWSRLLLWLPQMMFKVRAGTWGSVASAYGWRVTKGWTISGGWRSDSCRADSRPSRRADGWMLAALYFSFKYGETQQNNPQNINKMLPLNWFKVDIVLYRNWWRRQRWHVTRYKRHYRSAVLSHSSLILSAIDKFQLCTLNTPAFQ